MTSFAIKGWLLGSARISGTFSKMSRSYPACTITVVINGKEQTFDGTKLMKWLAIFDVMEKNPLSTLQIRIDGEGEKELAIKMISFLWDWDIGKNMYMLVLPNHSLNRALVGDSALYEEDDDYWAEYIIEDADKYIKEYTDFSAL